MKLEVHPGKGLRQVQFGSSQDAVISLLGTPDKILNTEFGDKEFFYNSLKIILKFESENENLLGWMEIKNPEVLIFNQCLVGKPKKEVINFLSSKLPKQKIEEEEFRDFESLTFLESWIELQFSFQELVSINFGVIYNENDQPIWPKG